MSAVEIPSDCRDSNPRSDCMLEAAYRDHFSSLLRFLKSHRYDDATAHDLAQTAFLRLAQYKKRGDIRDVESFLFRTVLNLSKNYNREKASFQRAALEYGEDFAVNGHHVATPEEDAIERERLVRLEEAFAQLPKKRRKALSFWLFSAKSRPEIAEQLGMSEAALAMHIMRAMRHCRKAIEDVSINAATGSASTGSGSGQLNGFDENEREDR